MLVFFFEVECRRAQRLALSRSGSASLFLALLFLSSPDSIKTTRSLVLASPFCAVSPNLDILAESRRSRGRMREPIPWKREERRSNVFGRLSRRRRQKSKFFATFFFFFLSSLAPPILCVSPKFHHSYLSRVGPSARGPAVLRRHGVARVDRVEDHGQMDVLGPDDDLDLVRRRQAPELALGGLVELLHERLDRGFRAVGLPVAPDEKGAVGRGGRDDRERGPALLESPRRRNRRRNHRRRPERRRRSGRARAPAGAQRGLLLLLRSHRRGACCGHQAGHDEVFRGERESSRGGRKEGKSGERKKKEKKECETRFLDPFLEISWLTLAQK